jgi:hypothetical protein
MPKTYNLSCSPAAVSFSVSRLDEQVFQVILDRVYPQRSPFEEISNIAELMRDSARTILLRRIIFWANSEKPRSAPREALFEEVMAALSHLERDLAAFTCAYSTSCNRTISVHGQEMPMAISGSGTLASIRLPGDDSHWYILQCGVARCELQKLATDQSRKTRLVDVIDLRGEKSLATGNFGIIKLKRRSIKTDVPDSLRRLAEFLRQASGETVQIAWSD